MVLVAQALRGALDALDLVRRRLEPLPAALHLELEDGELRAFRRLDMLHLDADALHDRLAHWTRERLAQVLPAASAGVSFRNAAPAAPHEASTLDVQEQWLGLEPTFALELALARPAEVERFASLVPEFMEVIEKSGRPEGYRTPDVGTME